MPQAELYLIQFKGTVPAEIRDAKGKWFKDGRTFYSLFAEAGSYYAIEVEQKQGPEHLKLDEGLLKKIAPLLKKKYRVPDWPEEQYEAAKKAVQELLNRKDRK